MKRGLHVHEEGAHCMELGSAVAPKILGLGKDYYFMEHLRPVPLTPDLPLRIEQLLANSVWSRDPLDCRPDWHRQLTDSTGIEAPSWTWADCEQCLTHGDPTVANVMSRPVEGVNNGQYLLCDPVPPGRRVPQIREIDQAKIVQSMLGWEAMIGGNALQFRGLKETMTYELQEWEEPDFLQDGMGSAHLRRLLFWTGVTMRRCIDHLDRDPYVRDWCRQIQQETFHAAGI